MSTTMLVLRIILITIAAILAEVALEYFSPFASPVYHPVIVNVFPLAAAAAILVAAFCMGYKKESFIATALMTSVVIAVGITQFASLTSIYNGMLAEYNVVHDKPAVADAIFEAMAASEIRNNPSAWAETGEAKKEALTGTYYLAFASVKDMHGHYPNAAYVCLFIKPAMRHFASAMKLYAQAGKSEKADAMQKLRDKFLAITPPHEQCS